jgi:hypothetical protein
MWMWENQKIEKSMKIDSNQWFESNFDSNQHWFGRSLLPTVHRRSPSPTTPMDSNRINNRTILRITGTTGNILLHSIRLPCPIPISTRTLILLLVIIIHLKQQISFIISLIICQFVGWLHLNDGQIHNL